MLVPKKNRLAVYSFLFKEGVIVTKKDHSMTKHPQLEVPNLHVCKLLQSLKSRAVVTEKFNWQYLYYTLTDDGIEYLRNYLHVSEETVPATLKKPSKPQPPASFGHAMRDGEERGRGGFRGGRGGRGGFGGGFRAPMGPPESVVEIGVFSHVCKNDIVCKATNLNQVPKVTKRAFFENSEQMGIVDEVLGPVEGYLFSVRLNEGVVASSFKEGAKIYMDPRDLLHMDIFTKPRSRNSAARGPRGVGGARGGFGGGRGGGRGGFGGGRGGGRGGFGGGRGGFGGGRGGAPRGGGFGGGRGGFGGGRGRGGF